MVAQISVEGWAAIIGICLTILGGLGGFVASKLAVSQKMVEATFLALENRITRLEKENDELEAKLERVLMDFAEVRARERELLAKLQHMESAHMDMPVPMWLKDLNGVMLSCNKIYEQVFLVPRGLTAQDYLGRSDMDVWPAEVAEEFMHRDAQVRLTRKEWRGIEMVQDADGVSRPWYIIKFPRYAAGGVLVGIGGIAVEKETVYKCETCKS